jgi:hypothetical protein
VDADAVLRRLAVIRADAKEVRDSARTPRTLQTGTGVKLQPPPGKSAKVSPGHIESVSQSDFSAYPGDTASDSKQSVED